jgi:hypothetical protein
MQESTRRQSIAGAGLDALVSGSVAALLSTLVTSWASQRETGHPASGTNATSHWVWGRRAFRQDQAALRYTLVGYLIHHASSIWWAAVHTAWLQRANGRGRLAKAIAVTAAAYVVDYRVVPRRLTPGFEARLSTPMVGLIYAAFAVGLAVARVTRTPIPPQPSSRSGG